MGLKKEYFDVEYLVWVYGAIYATSLGPDNLIFTS